MSELVSYTLEELHADIRKMEGIEVQLEEWPPGTRLLKLYSDYYSSPVPKDAEVNTLKNRINVFMQVCVMPPVDREPDLTKDISVYTSTLPDQRSKFLFVTALNKDDPMAPIFDNLSDDVVMIMGYYTDDNEVSFFKRQIH